MTNLPNYMDPNSPGGARISKMAISAMILGILGVLTAIIGIGLIFGIIGLILGIISLLAIGQRPQELGGRGIALTGIIMSILSLVMAPIMILLVAILLPSLGRARELSNRAYCAANLRGITQSMNVYAADDTDGRFPVVMPSATAGTYTMAQGRAGNTNTLVDQSLTTMYDKGTSSACAGSVTACWWILVLKNQVTPKQFICKSDPAASREPGSTRDAGGVFNLDFQNTAQFSYSSAYPWNPASGSPMAVGGWWKNLTDSSLPIMSDMAPLDGTGSRPVEAVAGSGSGPVGGNAKSWNSNNHARDGQNVAFSDSHVEFARRPDVGPNSDNIWTHNGTGGPAQNGTPIGPGSVSSGYGVGAPAPGSFGAPPYDVVMVPAADVSTGERK